MKKQFQTIRNILLLALLLVTSSAIFYACKKSSDLDEASKEIALKNPVISKFVNSPEFKKNSSTFSSYGMIDYSKIVVDSVVHLNKVYHVLYVPIFSGNKVVASIQALDLLDTKNLPNNETYALNLMNLKAFDNEKLNGTVKMIDLNYDNFEHSIITIENNKIKKWAGNGLSPTLKSKYSSLAIEHKSNVVYSNGKISEANVNKISAVKPVLCDGNGNGNLSFSECYKCFNDAIDQDGFSSWVCDIPVAGWVSCWGSVSATCVILSSIY